jgi:hypothetical protein
LDLFSSTQDDFVAAKVDAGRCNAVQALVVPLVVVILDEGPDLASEVTGHVIVLPAAHSCNAA